MILKIDRKNTNVKDLQNIKNGIENILLNEKIKFSCDVLDDYVNYKLDSFIGDKVKKEILQISRKIIFVQNKSSREYNKYDLEIVLDNGLKIGNGNFTFIAGPCSVESEEQIINIALFLKSVGVDILRGGAYKPRTSPYDFQGIGKDGILLLEKAKKISGLPIVTELMSLDQLEYFDNVDIIQVGARNMQNFELLRELGKIKKPILLKRGFSSTYKEVILSSEYILSGGNNNVILCERGIRTFENSVRNTFDVTAIPYLKEHTNLPVIADPSHSAGLSKYVPAISKAAVASGSDGIMIEVHNNPSEALSDGEQALDFEKYSLLKKELDNILNVMS